MPKKWTSPAITQKKARLRDYESKIMAKAFDRPAPAAISETFCKSLYKTLASSLPFGWRHRWPLFPCFLSAKLLELRPHDRRDASSGAPKQ